MGVDVAAQFAALWKSVLLGVGFALVYDGLRAVRLHRRRQRALTDALDVLYCLMLGCALFSFALRIGQGELRLYMAFAVTAGAVLSFSLLSPLLRPLWDFWADSLFAFLRLCRLPLRLGKKYYGKLHKLSKRLFLFARNSFIIKNCERSAISSRRRAERKEGVCYGREKSPPRQRFRPAAHSRAAAARRHTRHEPSEKDQHR